MKHNASVREDADAEIARLTKECDSKEEAYNKCYFDYKYWKDKANEYKHRAEVAERALLTAPKPKPGLMNSKEV